MRVAFYAPLKGIDHPSPSGDRRMARSFKALLGELGHEVRIASRLRSFDRNGDACRQRRIASLGNRCADRLSGQFQQPGAWRPDLWFTYHAYHKAPDHIGPGLSRILNIPYVIAEASIAGKQRNGAWHPGHETSLDAVRRADAVIAMTAVDEWNLHRWVQDQARVLRFVPFIDTVPFQRQLNRKLQNRGALAQRFHLDVKSVWLVVAAMMRDDIKKDSYLALVEALHQTKRENWQIVVIGDGPARESIASSFAGLGENRSVLTGEVPEQELSMFLSAGDVYVWPAFEEAYGIAILEAQAAGLPAVACREGGVPDILMDGETGILLPDRSAAGFAKAVDCLIADAELRGKLSRQASALTSARHDWKTARSRLGEIIEAVTGLSQYERPCV